MGYAERNVWAGLMGSVICVAVYVSIVAPQLLAASGGVAAIDWQWPMVLCLGGGLLFAIVLSILWGIVAGMRDRSLEHRSDIRDRDIERMGARVGQAFTVIGALAALILAMVGAETFWIGNAIFFGFFLAAAVGGVAQLIAYRRGLV